MVYIFDTSSLHVFRSYFPDRFPTFWDRLDAAATSGEVRSVREVRRELEVQGKAKEILDWSRKYSGFFPSPGPEDTAFVAEIFKVRHFQNLVGNSRFSKDSRSLIPSWWQRRRYAGGVL